MAKHIVIERPGGVVTFVRSDLETGMEDPLTVHEEIINELFQKIKDQNTTIKNANCFITSIFELLKMDTDGLGFDGLNYSIGDCEEALNKIK